MLKITNLHASVEGAAILHGIDLQVAAGEVHAIMGPNGSGKSTLAKVLGGRDGYEVTEGSVEFDGQDLLAMEIEDRARAGLFLGFQYPVEIPGVSNLFFLKAAVNAVRHHRGEPEFDAMDFMKEARKAMATVKLDAELAKRAVNQGFSGGEKKRNEVFQMLMLDPKVAILDETDSGLDIDALKVIAEGIETLRGPTKAMVLITHYQRLLDYVTPDQVHVLKGGRIVRSGGPGLAQELEEQGYAAIAEAG